MKLWEGIHKSEQWVGCEVINGLVVLFVFPVTFGSNNAKFQCSVNPCSGLATGDFIESMIVIEVVVILF